MDCVYSPNNLLHTQQYVLVALSSTLSLTTPPVWMKQTGKHLRTGGILRFHMDVKKTGTGYSKNGWQHWKVSRRSPHTYILSSHTSGGISEACAACPTSMAYPSITSRSIFRETETLIPYQTPNTDSLSLKQSQRSMALRLQSRLISIKRGGRPSPHWLQGVQYRAGG
jgi:hypothetical protein